MMGSILSASTGRHSFLADVTCYGNSSQESEERRNDVSFFFFRNVCGTDATPHPVVEEAVLALIPFNNAYVVYGLK